MKIIICSFVTLSVTFGYTTTLGQIRDTTRASTPNPTTTVGIPLADTMVAPAITQNGTTAHLNTGLTLTGFLDVYYTHDFTAPKTAQERPHFLYNHTRNREVNVNLAFIKAAYTHERVRGNLALQVGTYAQYNYVAEQELIKNIFEANAGIKLSKTKHVWLDAGIFSSHIGFESAISKDCWTLTRSILAENSPYYLAGAKLTYTSSNGKWTMLGSVLNGWQRVKKPDGYSGPSVSSQLQYRPSPKLTLNWSSFIGADRPDSLQQSRFFNNVYVLINPTGRFGLILGFDIGADRKPVAHDGRREGKGRYIWYSPVLIARLATSSKSFLAGRIEYYHDPNGVIIRTGTTNGFQTAGYSINYDYAIQPNALFRLEGKVYHSKDPIFQTDRGMGGGVSQTNWSMTTSIAISF